MVKSAANLMRECDNNVDDPYKLLDENVTITGQEAHTTNKDAHHALASVTEKDKVKYSDKVKSPELTVKQKGRLHYFRI